MMGALFNLITLMCVFIHYWYSDLPTVKPSYNDISLCDSFVYSVKYSVIPINSSLLTITLYSSVRTIIVYDGTKYSVHFMML